MLGTSRKVSGRRPEGKYDKRSHRHSSRVLVTPYILTSPGSPSVREAKAERDILAERSVESGSEDGADNGPHPIGSSFLGFADRP
jgi:hypothetical protein